MAMCHLYGIDHETTTDLVRMADASGERNYVEDHHGRGVEDRYWMYTDLEAIAAVQVHYSADLVPDLLQTPAYVRAVIAADITLSREVVERRAAHRKRRQDAYFGRGEPGRLEVLIPASALDLVVGSPEVTAEQLAHLVALDDRGEVCTRVLPGLHGCRDGSFTIMDFGDPDDPPVVCTHTLIGSRYVELPQQVASYREAAATLREQSVPLAEYLRERAAGQILSAS